MVNLEDYLDLTYGTFNSYFLGGNISMKKGKVNCLEISLGIAGNLCSRPDKEIYFYPAIASQGFDWEYLNLSKNKMTFGLNSQLRVNYIRMLKSTENTGVLLGGNLASSSVNLKSEVIYQNGLMDGTVLETKKYLVNENPFSLSLGGQFGFFIEF